MVLIKCKNKTRRLPARYLSNLKGKERSAQIRSICQGKKRPTTSFKTRKSSYTTRFNSKYGKQVDALPGGRSVENISKVTKIPQGALEEVFQKGVAAYYNGGSRPNQTPESWAYARVYSYILGGNTRKVDDHITQKYKVRFA
jgi:hypothetical protein